jgi:DNA replication and repair protein RecF
LKALTEYRRVAQQRGALLRTGLRDAEALEQGLRVWDEELLRFGAEVMRRRAEALVDLQPRAEKFHARLGGHGELSMRYVAQGLGRRFSVGPELVQAFGDAEDLQGLFQERLRERRPAELARRVNLVGPHRDDVEFEVDRRDLRRYGSQGQCRTAAVALKMAQAEYIREHRRERPVVLLDDIFAELDEERAGCLWDVVCREHQTLLAVPRRSDLRFGEGDAVFRVEAGRLTRED